MSENNSLSEDDWLHSDHPATDEEIEQLVEKMENDFHGDEAHVVFDRILKEFSD